MRAATSFFFFCSSLTLFVEGPGLRNGFVASIAQRLKLSPQRPCVFLRDAQLLLEVLELFQNGRTAASGARAGLDRSARHEAQLRAADSERVPIRKSAARDPLAVDQRAAGTVEVLHEHIAPLHPQTRMVPRDGRVPKMQVGPAVTADRHPRALGDPDLRSLARATQHDQSRSAGQITSQRETRDSREKKGCSATPR